MLPVVKSAYRTCHGCAGVVGGIGAKFGCLIQI